MSMTSTQGVVDVLSEELDEKWIASASTQRSNALSNKLNGVLSASYADSEIRDALRTLDERRIPNSAKTRRGLRLDVQKEMIDQNGEIIKSFGHVAEVCTLI